MYFYLWQKIKLRGALLQRSQVKSGDMSSNFKDIGLGLTVGVGIGALLITGMFWVAQSAPLSDVQPVAAQEEISTPKAESPATPTQPFLPTLTIFPTQEFSPSPTPGFVPLKARPSAPPPTATIMTEPLVLTGPLNGEEQAQLHAASLFFVAPDYYASKAIGEKINGVGYGHPSNICGPLAIAILQSGYILSEKVIPYDFWLLNPDVYEDRLKLKAVFPESRFDSLRNKTALNLVDWENSPLQPGDFLYLYSGSRGNFEHMLAVTRVDEAGRAYSVTNHATEEDGFIIAEKLLYDPNNPGEGLFYQWTEREKAPLGSTGFEGFQLWRLREE